MDTDDLEGYFWLKEKLKAQKIDIPIFADESVKTSRDVVKLLNFKDLISENVP